MRHLSGLSKWAINKIPPIIIILSFLSGGIYYKDEVKEIKFWFNSPDSSVDSLEGH